MNNKTLYVTDLDGTLMRYDKTVSDYTIDTLNSLIDQGMLITYATARSFHSAWEITKEIHFSVPVITRNGTVLADQIQKKETDILSFSDCDVKRLRQMLSGIIEPMGFVTAYFDGHMSKSYRQGELNIGLRKYVDEHSGDKRMRLVSDDTDLFAGTVNYVTLIAAKEELQPVYEKVCHAGNWECVFQKDTYGEEYWLEICPYGATKAQAILKCKESLGCDRIVVFGDSTNDLSMFAIADEACAVANAIDEVKRKATHIIAGNEDDGVAKFLMNQWFPPSFLMSWFSSV